MPCRYILGSSETLSRFISQTDYRGRCILVFVLFMILQWIEHIYAYNSNFECLFVEEYLIILPFEMRVPCHTIVMICNNNRHNFNYFICAAIWCMYIWKVGVYYLVLYRTKFFYVLCWYLKCILSWHKGELWMIICQKLFLKLAQCITLFHRK